MIMTLLSAHIGLGEWFGSNSMIMYGSKIWLIAGLMRFSPLFVAFLS